MGNKKYSEIIIILRIELNRVLTVFNPKDTD
jgi:hypothetical protein